MMSDPTTGSSSTNNPEAAYGGADAVEKTTYVVGQGTDPNAIHNPKIAAGGGKSASSPLLWIALGIAAFVAVVYLAGMF